ncbi:MAG: DUF177 domain-containing protein [Candidatus Omnitrophica bacterium]|nr:DUF177 domain-containing protein [Candidatus Omnitrophota bacterium]
MKIALRDIPDTGTLNLVHTFGLNELDLCTDSTLLSEPVNINVKISKGINIVIVDAQIRGAMQFDCARCLKAFKWPFDKSARFDYQVQPNDSYIIVDDNLREEIVLDFPVKPLCKSDCRGLCPNCGEDLNLALCKCKK